MEVFLSLLPLASLRNAEERNVVHKHFTVKESLVQKAGSGISGSTGRTVSQTTPKYSCMLYRETNASA